ncbi:MAG: glycosyltransferase family 2 protein [Flexilinea sp.]|nr:glycosyltransferase family 2 protein [Flexilinea sp.]
MKPVYSIVAPVYNERECLDVLYTRVSEVMDSSGEPWELVLVDDGSTDGSSEIMKRYAEKDPRVRCVFFARNFGHQIAVTAGMDNTLGDAVIVIDADLQDPPEVILSLIREWKKGYEVVYAVRKERDGESWFKKWTASAFYRLIDKIADVRIPLDTGDFRLYDRKVVNVMKQMPERNRFLRGMSSWVGFKQTGVEYHREERYAGTTHYPLKKMLKLALTAITGFSTVPLQLATWLGFGITGLSVIAVIIDLFARGENGTAISVFFMGGVLLIILGIIGEYIGRIYDEVRNRPLYVTREITKSVYDKTEENQ